jgi:hypothetical protein
MKNVLAFASAAMLAALILTSPAVAADAGSAAVAAQPVTVTIPWGDWLGQLLTATATIVVSLIGWTVHRFAPQSLQAFITNDVIAKAVDYAIATTAGAAHGKTASIPVSNELIAVALNWIVANEPKIADWSGANLRPLIVAKLAASGVVPSDASASTLALQTPASGAAA